MMKVLRQFRVSLSARAVSTLLVMLSIAALSPEPVFASINQEVSYQAVLKDSSGNNVSNGNYNIRFRLYASSTGGTALWTEEWCKGACNGGAGADNRISVSNGLFSTQLGQVTSLAGVDFNQPLYLGVEIGGSAASSSWDGEMTPRKKIGSSPSSFNSDKLNGQAASYYLDANNLNNFNSKWASVFSGTTTNALAEGTTNKYYTDARARAALSSGSLALVYSTSTGVLTIADASVASSGVVTTGTQSFAGAKTFTGDITENGALTVIGSGSFATGTFSGNLGVGTSALLSDRLAVNGVLALGQIGATTLVSPNTGYGKLFTKPASGGGNDSYTKSLLHFDGSDGSTSMTDSSSLMLTYTAYGGAKLSTAVSKFGTAVLSLAGTSSYVASPPVIDFTTSTAGDEGDIWFYPTSISGIRPIAYLGTGIATSTDTFTGIYLDNGVPTVESWQNGAQRGSNIVATSAVAINTWNHLALARTNTGSNYQLVMYINGVAVGSATSTIVQGVSGQTMCIGSNKCFTGGNSFFAGYMDEFRLTRGTARYTANFTPETAPYGSGLFFVLPNGVTNEVGSGGGGGGSGGSIIDTAAFHAGGDTFESDAMFGLQDNYALRFITNNIERLRVTADGKMGIGTTTPDTTLSVVGSTTISSGLKLSSLAGGLLRTDANGNVSVVSPSALAPSNSLSSLGNVMTSIVNTSTSTASIINSNSLTWLGQTLTGAVNGVATTSVVIPYASTSSDGLLSTTTQNLAGAKTFTDAITASTTGNIIPFAFANQTSFPNATTYRGSIAHSTADGAMFFASGGVWTQLLDAATGFKNGGNAFSANAVLGTTDAFALRFIASSSEAMRITTTGRVGIGTTSPVALLDVYGDGILEGSNRYLNFGTATSSNGYGFRDSGGVMQFKNSGGNWANIATTTNDLPEGSSNLYYTDTRAHNAISSSATGLNYSTSTGILSLASGYSLFNSQVLNWSGQTLTSTINGIATTTTISYANATTDGLVSSSTQTFGGAKTFNGALSLGSTFGVTGVSTLATTSATQFTASGASTLSAGLTLSALTGGLLQSNGLGAVSTTSLASLLSNSLTSSVNVLTSNINGVISTTTAVNSVSNTSNANTLSTTVNGITGSTVSLINSNLLTSSINTMQSVINGVGTTTADIINSNALSWLGQTLTSTINGVATTTTISYANATTDGLVSSSTQTFGGNKTFNGAVSLGSTLSVTGTSTLATTTVTKFTASDGVTFSTMTTGSILFATTSGVISQSNSQLFWDSTNGHLGIGTTTPSVALHVADNTIRLNDNRAVAPTRTNVGEIGIGAIGTGANNGRIWIRAGSTATNFFFQSQSTGDFSEFFRVTDMTLKTGEVMAVNVLLGADASSTRYAARSTRSYDPQILGVVGRPGEGTANNNDRDGMRDFDPTYKNISILGQTPVLVTDENGLVRSGDRLTSSSRPGYAMKMTHGGMSLGYALADATSSDQLLDIYLDPGQFMTPEEAGLVSELVSTSSTNISSDGPLSGLFRHLIAWFSSASNGISDFFARRVVTQEICVADASGSRSCIDKQGFDALISGAHANMISSPPPSDPTPSGTSGSNDSGATSSPSTDSGSSTPPSDSIGGGTSVPSDGDAGAAPGGESSAPPTDPAPAPVAP